MGKIENKDKKPQYLRMVEPKKIFAQRDARHEKEQELLNSIYDLFNKLTTEYRKETSSEKFVLENYMHRFEELQARIDQAIGVLQNKSKIEEMLNLHDEVSRQIEGLGGKKEAEEGTEETQQIAA